MAKNVKVYSTATCPYCKMLKSFLREKNVPFEDIDVGNNRSAADEMVKKSKQMSVPVIDIEGKIIIGFNREQISLELEK